MSNLRPCPECDCVISRDASQCPQCGHRFNRLPGGAFALWAIFAVILLAGVWIGR